MGGYLLGDQPQTSAFPWLTQSWISQRFGEHGETGIDLAMNVGTPITALVAGTIGEGSGYDTTGGFCGILTQIDGHPAAVYTQHLDMLAVSDGQHVQPGDLIGYSGGQTSGGHHPATQGSTGPHIEVGINFPWGGGRNPLGYEPNYDPLPFLQAVANGTSVALALPAITANIIQRATTAPGFASLCIAMDDAMTFDPVNTSSPAAAMSSISHNGGAFFARGTVVVLGLVTLLACIFWLLRPAAEKAVQVAELAAV